MPQPDHGLLLGLGDNDHPQYALAGDVGGAIPSGTRMVFDQNAAPVGWTRDTSSNDRVIRIVSGARVDGGTWTQPGHTHTGPSHTHTTPNHSHSGPSHNHSNPNTGTEPDHSHNLPAHSHSIADHAHTINQHQHLQQTTGATTTTAVGQEGTGSTFEYVIKAHTHSQGVSVTGGDTATGAGGVGTNPSAILPVTNDGSHAHTQANTGNAGTGTTSSDNGGSTGSGGTGSTGSGATANSWRPLHRDMIVAVKD